MRDDYAMLRLRDVPKCVNLKVNLIAVIIEFGLPKKSRGPDYCCTLRLVDESHHKTSISAIMFAAKVEELPRVAAAGDIIQLSHVGVDTHGRVTNVVFSENFSSFALYKGKDDGDSFAPYQVSSKFHPREENKMFIYKLRKWLVSFQPQEDLNDFPMLREIKDRYHINLACKILHCCETAKDQWFIFAWDGTDTPPNVISSKLEDESYSPLPLQVEPLPLPREVLCTWPTVGSIMRITYDNQIEMNNIYVPKAGEWVKFVNIHLVVHAGLWLGIFTTFSKFRYTHNEDCLIVERQRLSEERISLNSGRMLSCLFPNPPGITVVNHEMVTPVTLMHVITHSEITAKFKCVVRVVAAFPCQAENLCLPDGKYRMRLTLEDSTARIHAFMVAEDGERFFDGHPGNEVLTGKLNRLLGTEESDGIQAWLKKDESPRNPPWISVCLMSFYASKANIWGTRHFRVFDTKLVEET